MTPSASAPEPARSAEGEPAVGSADAPVRSAGTAPDSNGAVPPELREVAERLPGALPPGVAVDRVALTPYHAVLSGRAADLDGVAALLETLGRSPGIEEPELRRTAAGERGVEFTVVLSPRRQLRGASGEPPAPPEPPPYAAPAVARSLFRLLLPPFT